MAHLLGHGQFDPEAAGFSVSLVPPATLACDNLSLRAWTVDDTSTLARTLVASEAHLRAFTPWVVDGRLPGQSLEARLAMHAQKFRDGAEWVYGIFDATSGELLGGCGLYPRVGPGAVEIGYWVAAAHTSRGIATRATRALAEIAFGAAEIERVELHCDTRNIASARIPERLGYSLARVAEEPNGAVGIWVMSRERFMALSRAAL